MKAPGFTIVEMIVTVVVISILVGMAFFGLNRIQADSRNAARSSKIKIVYEALESYYAKKGEYPGCLAMTASGSQVSTNTLVGIEQNVLVTPKAPSSTTNSFTCTALVAGVGGADAFAYVGDGTATCNTGTACTRYTLQYRDEVTGSIVSQASRRQ